MADVGVVAQDFGEVVARHELGNVDHVLLRHIVVGELRVLLLHCLLAPPLQLLLQLIIGASVAVGADKTVFVRAYDDEGRVFSLV